MTKRSNKRLSQGWHRVASKTALALALGGVLATTSGSTWSSEWECEQELKWCLNDCKKSYNVCMTGREDGDADEGGCNLVKTHAEDNCNNENNSCRDACELTADPEQCKKDECEPAFKACMGDAANEHQRCEQECSRDQWRCDEYCYQEFWVCC